MKFPKECKIEQAISHDSSRWALTDAYLDCQDAQPVLVATNGNILAIVPVEADPSEAGFVTAPALRAARKLAGRHRAPMADLACNGDLRTPDGCAFPRPTELSERKSQFPNWRALMRCADKPSTMKIVLNAASLMQLAEALGTDIVTLDVETPLQAIRVTPSKPTDSRRGVIIPYANKAK